MNQIAPEQLRKLEDRIQYCRQWQKYINCWEKSFLISLGDSIECWQNITWPQQKTLRKIYDKIIWARG